MGFFLSLSLFFVPIGRPTRGFFSINIPNTRKLLGKEKMGISNWPVITYAGHVKQDGRHVPSSRILLAHHHYFFWSER